ncbi:hypothetical protein CBM2589_B180087 [Cupriavidus taiwanensis]|uniref:Uncharacterized protein n=1 Tax=Cupriavidus taiwanensis TaxID=164546 RepID=A0A375BKZ2_9BURK|nr:hypothetical protein CBM2589_B180087 [Cupriavidus taiwanensis]
MKKGRGPPACEPRVARQAAALGLLLYCLLLVGWDCADRAQRYCKRLPSPPPLSQRERGENIRDSRLTRCLLPSPACGRGAGGEGESVNEVPPLCSPLTA